MLLSFVLQEKLRAHLGALFVRDRAHRDGPCPKAYCVKMMSNWESYLLMMAKHLIQGIFMRGWGSYHSIPGKFLSRLYPAYPNSHGGFCKGWLKLSYQSTRETCYFEATDLFGIRQIKLSTCQYASDGYAGLFCFGLQKPSLHYLPSPKLPGFSCNKAQKIQPKNLFSQ